MSVKFLIGSFILIALAGCGGSSTPVTTGTPTTQDRIKEELKDAGTDIKSAATQAAANMKPALQTAKEDTRGAVHDAAEKVADWTATRPATIPQ